MTAVGKKTAAVVLAAGSGKRMGTSVHKQYLLIKGKPVIYYTLRAFELSEVDEIILVTGADEIDYCSREIVEKYNFQKVRAVIAGGKERYDSVYEGLKALSDCDYVLIHDGARPLISSVLINANISCVQEKEACITAVPAKDTIKVADNKGYVSDTRTVQNCGRYRHHRHFPMPLYQKHIEKEQKRGIPPSQTMPWLLKNMPTIPFTC